MQRLLLVLLALLLFCQILFPLAHANDNEDPTPVINYIRGLQIDFTPPDLVQDCGSLFDLKINLTKFRFLPTIFSVSVFLKVKDDYGKELVYRIGFEPFVYIPPLHREPVTVKVTCLTNKDLIQRFFNLDVCERERLSNDSAQIGVKIDKVGSWWAGSLIWNYYVNSGFKLRGLLLSLDEDFYIRMFSKTEIMQPVRQIRLLNLVERFNSVLKRNNQFIEWRDTEVVPGLVCSDSFDLYDVRVNDSTDKNGYFTVNYSIRNDLDQPLPALITVDVSSIDKPVMNSIMPIFNDKFYNTGYDTFMIPEDGVVGRSLRCRFPEGSMFDHTNYSVFIELIPYVDIDNMSQFGIIFYDIRWDLFIRSYYVVNQTVEKQVERAWYNLPIYYGDPSDGEMFPSEKDKIYYAGKTVIDSLDEVVDIVNDTVEGWIVMYVSGSGILIGVFLAGLWIVRKTSGRFRY